MRQELRPGYLRAESLRAGHYCPEDLRAGCGVLQASADRPDSCPSGLPESPSLRCHLRSGYLRASRPGTQPTGS